MTLADLLANRETLEQVRYYVSVGRISYDVYRAYLHEWQTSAPRFSTQACHCASCLSPANKVEEEF